MRAARRDTPRMFGEQTSHCQSAAVFLHNTLRHVQESRTGIKKQSEIMFFCSLLQDAPVGLLTCCSCISQSHGSILAFTLSDRSRSQWKPGVVHRCSASAGWSPAKPSQEGFPRTDPLSTVSDIQLSRLLISNHICDASAFRAFPKPPQLYGKIKPTCGALQDTDTSALSSVPFLRATDAWPCSPMAAPSEQSSISKMCQVPTPRAAVRSLFLHTTQEVHLHETAAALCQKVQCIFQHRE